MPVSGARPREDDALRHPVRCRMTSCVRHRSCGRTHAGPPGTWSVSPVAVTRQALRGKGQGWFRLLRIHPPLLP
ncbi:hypothetical protein OPV22_008531 [Ensete ventricosum]|uniref:Uncharacterized protein n=1 Tax=Ensete ventricosum TaxID=4639 RepID=A0AAV8PPY6_ENSVE|nr:hypothetical protein OPV22_008531 [Ensete ventricosum]